ncbi:hypothetical protein [Burkholderia perseverans]|uniref:hypothetical protein n=1 Tax=Burkholderia perseverans TaxID=2615214 RepID=UPI001FEDFF53|nr:hypothetical protein [Burkholderia perseverans]
MSAPKPLFPLPDLPLGEPYGFAARLGLVGLATDTAIERDFHRMVPGDGVGVFSTRVCLDMPDDEPGFAALSHEIAPAMRRLVPGDPARRA